jgi:BirA family biotin operon repressor/biotin-[acetyl-CoA-carboxylase] ligase
MRDKLSFDLLSEDKIKSVLHTEFLAKKVYAFWSVGSTNEFAYRRASQGEKEGILVIAEEQTKGKGRKSRQWDSPFNKGLWFSLILRPELSAAMAGIVPYLAGVSVAEAVENFLGLKPDVKWPNDLLLNGRKFCGILSEVEFENGQINFIILGIGINVNHKKDEFPEEFRAQATSLRIESDLRIDRADFLAEVLLQLEKNYSYMKQNGFEDIINKWKKRCTQFGKEIIVVQDDDKYQGVFEELDDKGCLLLRTKDGKLKKIVAGDIAF